MLGFDALVSNDGPDAAAFPGVGFAFDNEGPRHAVYLRAFRVADRPVTNGEYREFMEAGGYDDASAWLSEGWRTVQERGWDTRVTAGGAHQGVVAVRPWAFFSTLMKRSRVSFSSAVRSS